MQYEYLNRFIKPGSASYTEAWTRVLSRLGEYTDIILRGLNMRPTDVHVLAQTNQHILVRLSTPAEHLVLRIAPESSLVCELFFNRTMSEQRLPAARIVQHDLRRSLVPFDYMLERYVCGIPAGHIEAQHAYLLRAVARQAGRLLRRMHRVRVPGWGSPTVNQRWLLPDWQAVLLELHQQRAPLAMAALLFDESEQAALEALAAHVAGLVTTPYLMHGAFGPAAARCTIGDHVQLEAIVEPGAVVAGDGLLDLACGLDPSFPAEWCSGLYEGYTGTAPLTASERQRLPLLQLLTCYWSTCQRYARAEPHTAACDRTRQLLAECQPLLHGLLADSND